MKTVFITGASTGIGKATAKFFHEKGWQVAATMRKPSEVEDLVDSDNLKKIMLDVQDKNCIKKALEQAKESFGKIDVLLNNAGYGTAGPLEAATDEQVKRQFDVNLFGVIDMIKGILPHFRERKEGLIINVSSIGGLVTFPLFSLYHASKWAIEGLTESLQYELNPLGIKLKIVEPGGVKTDFAGRSLDLFDITNCPDYKVTVERMMANFGGERSLTYSTSEQMASYIFEAATDGSDQFRYVSGDDAKQIWELRQKLQYEEFRESIRQQMLG